MGENVERADQHHDGKELVGVRRRGQQHEGEYLAQVIVDLAQVGELADQVEKGEQAQEAEQHERRRAVDLACQIALQGADLHRYLPIRRRMSCMRWANMTSSSTTMPACTSHQPTPKSILPCATRAWLTLSRLE